MRLVYLTPSVFPNEKSHPIQILNTAHSLARAGVQVELIVKSIAGGAERALDQYGLPPHPNLIFRRLSKSGKRVNRWSGRTFRWRLGAMMLRNRWRAGPVVYYVRGGAKALHALETLLKVRGFTGAKVLYELHAIQHLDLVDEHHGRFGEGRRLEAHRQERRDLEARIYSRLDGMITISQRLSDLVQANFNVSCPILIAPSGAQLRSSACPPREGRDLDVCYVGSLYPFNGVDDLVEAMAWLPGRRLTVVGDGRVGDLERVRETARRAGVSDRVDFRGHRPHPEALATMRRARVVAAPLRLGANEDRASWCSPGKLIEYMVSGATIVASALPSLGEALRDRENALLNEPNSPKALSEVIERALSDERLGARLASRAFQDAQAFSFDARAQRIIEFIRKVST